MLRAFKKGPSLSSATNTAFYPPVYKTNWVFRQLGRFFAVLFLH